MAVPTPLAHWKMDDPASTTTILDEIAGYEADVGSLSSTGTGGVFGATGRGNGNTAYQNASPDTDDISWDSTASPGLASLLDPDEGSMSKWCNAVRNGSASNYLMSFSTSSLSISVYSELRSATASLLSVPANVPVVIMSKGATTNTVYLDNTSSWDGVWVLWTVTWSKSSNEFKFYANDTLIGQDTFPGDTGATSFAVQPVTGDIDLSSSNFVDNTTSQDFKIWDVPLTQDQITELFTGVVAVCEPTMPLRELRAIWKEVESQLPCLGTIQKDTILGWTDIATNVPMSIELTGARQELDSTDTFVSIQNWLVQMSGRVKLPNPGAFSTVRFVVAGLTLESYDFYQSPDDTVTTIECKKV